MLNQLKKNILENKTFLGEESILIFGDPRSGSTWLAEIVSKKLKACLIDEPLHLANDARLRKLNYGWRQFLPKNTDHPESLNFFYDLFCGQKLNPITLHKNSIHRTLFCKRLVFKIIRGKMLLPYLLQNFNFTHKPLFLVRHPLAVLHSMKLHSGWSFDFTPFQVPDILHNEIYLEHQEFLESLRSQEEIMLSLWCLSNQNIFANQKLYHKCEIVFYEKLIQDPLKVLSNLCFFHGVNLSESEFSFKSQTVGKSFIHDAEKQISKWKNFFTDQEIESFKAILDYFEIRIYNTEESVPISTYG